MIGAKMNAGNPSSEADLKANRVYDALESRFGHDDPRSSGYRSPSAFEFEANVIRTYLRRLDGCILDLACGHGLVTWPLAAEGKCVFGLDYNQVATCSASRRGLIALRGDAFSMPFKEATFGVVLSAEFIQQYDADLARQLVQSMARVTRPDGVVILVWRQGDSLMRRLITTVLRLLDAVRGRPSLKLYQHEFETVCGWARSHQLEISESFTVSPLLGLTIRNAESFGSRIFGTSYIAVFRRSP